MRNVIIVLMLLICSLAVTPKYAFTDEDPWEFADIHIAPIFNSGILGPFGGYMGGSGDWSDVTTAMDWSIGNTVPLSSTSTDDMVFSTTTGSWANPADWVERMRITKDGKVGIGTISPWTQLEINGNASSNINPIVMIETTGINSAAAIRFQNANSDHFNMGITPNGEFAISEHGKNIALSNDYLRITTSGNVGVGTTSPQTQLHVKALSLSSPPPTQRGIRVSLGAVNVNLVADGNEGFVGTRSTHPFRIVSDNTVRMVFNTNGNVGIGTTAPQGTLDVNGSIYQRGGQLHADYVFGSDYDLESIREHAEFMWSNKHLKAIPKSKVDENGMEIVEVGSHRKGIVEELEKAHIYIEQLKVENDKLKETLTAMADRQKSIEDMLLALSATHSKGKLVKSDQINIDEVQKAIQ